MQDPVAEAGEVGRVSGRGTVRGAEYASRSHPRVTWWKSSWSAYNGSCLEIGDLGAGWVGVRDSKAGPDGGVLTFTHADWAAFLQTFKG